MDKVSKIVASNSRIETVDLSKNKAGRVRLPGLTRDNVVPSERLPGANLSAVDRIQLTEEFKALKPSEARHVAIAERVQNDFFKTYNKKGEVPQLELPEVEDSAEEVPIKVSEYENLNMNNLSKYEEFAPVSQPVTEDPSTSGEEETINNSLDIYA